MDKEEIKRLLGWVMANFPAMQDKDMRPTAALWERMLADIPYQLAEKAVMRILATAKYFPTVGEIRETVRQMTAPQLPTPGEAWAEVVRQIKAVGSYGKPKFTHEAIAKAVDALGWKELCLSTEPNIDRAHFMRIYETLCNREKEEKINCDVLKLIEKVNIKQIGGS